MNLPAVISPALRPRGEERDRTGADQAFVPPFCPANRCPHHRHPPTGEQWYWKWGFFFDRVFGRVQRFRCRSCGSTFCTQTFSVHYHIKRLIDLPIFMQLLQSAASVRAIARLYHCSTGTVANRTDRLMRQALVALSDIAAESAGAEDLCADGFRSFCVSQYFPCDLTILVGDRSDTVYTLDYALLRRSGSMTNRQKRTRATLDSRVSFDPQASRKSFARILDLVIRLWVKRPTRQCVLHTDEHLGYQVAWSRHPHIQHLAQRQWAAHQRVSSQVARTATNPLRAANYVDREIRKDRADHHRETVCFARNVPMMLGRLAIYFAYHNLLKKRRIRGSRSPGLSETICESHARFAGIRSERLKAIAIGMVSHRRFFSRELLSPFYQQLWLKRIATPLKLHAERVPKYARA